MNTGPRTPRSVSSFHQHAFLAILCLWIIMPIALSGRVAQDAVPYVAAGRLAHSRPTDVYAARNGNLFDLEPNFRRAWCDATPEGTDCDNLAVAFVSSPPVVPLTVALHALGDRTATLLMQFAAAAMLAGGMWLLWKRLAHRTRCAPLLLVITALMLTPMAMVPIGLGQTSPILFLSVCVGASSISTRHKIGAAAAWSAAALLKVFPAALLFLLVKRRQRGVLGWSLAFIGVLSMATLAVVPASVWSDFLRTTLQLSGHTTTNPYNGSLDSLVVRIFGSSTTGVGPTLGRVASLAGAISVCWFSMRRTDHDTRWAGGYVALLVLTPLVWWHYLWLLVGAIGIALAARRRLDDRHLAFLPGIALVTIIPSIPNANGTSWPVVQALMLIALVIVFCGLASTNREPTDPTVTTSCEG